MWTQTQTITLMMKKMVMIKKKLMTVIMTMMISNAKVLFYDMHLLC